MSFCAAVLKSPPFNIVVLLALLAVLAASFAVFHLLTRRWTNNRRQASIEDWAADHNFQVEWSPDAHLPAPITGLHLPTVHPQSRLVHDTTTIAAFSTTTHPDSPQNTWHVLIRQTQQSWTGAALRPVGASRSIVDLFKLNGFPAALPSDRFVTFAAEARGAKELYQSPAAGLLPPDTGLLLHGSYIVLDFSTRPYDATEFTRLLTVMNQLESKLQPVRTPT